MTFCAHCMLNISSIKKIVLIAGSLMIRYNCNIIIYI